MPTATLVLHGDLPEVARAGAGPSVDVPLGEPRSVKDAVESVGIPHTEVGALAVDRVAADWDRLLVGGERVVVHPVDSVPAGWTPHLAPRPPHRPPRFVADVHLGTLARRLRLLGLDTWWSNDAGDARLARLASRTDRVLATRDRQLLMRRAVRHGVLVRSSDPRAQVRQLVQRYDLADQLAPRTRCVRCNGRLVPVSLAQVADQLEPGTRAAEPDRLARCDACAQVYWPGAHDRDLAALVAAALG